MKTIYQIKKAITRRLCFFKKIGYKEYGKHSLIYKPICILNKKYIKIGNNVTISEYARIEVINDWNKIKYHPSLEIGDNCSFEQYAKIICTTNLSIGHDCTFSYNVFISTANHDYTKIDKNISNQQLIDNPVKIGNYCFIGMDVKIFPGVTIGNNVIVGANSIVIHDLPSYTVCIGVPAKPIKKYNFDTKRWEKLRDET